MRCRRLWLRFPFLFSLPLLAFARWRGLSWHEVTQEVDHGYWDFGGSWLLRTLLPWVLLLDAALAAVRGVFIPLRLGYTIVCERFVLDMLADLAVAFNDYELHHGLPGRLYLHLIPRDAAVIALDLDVETIRARRADLRLDRRLESRLAAFRRIATDQSLAVFSSELTVTELGQRILEVIRDGNQQDR